MTNTNELRAKRAKAWEAAKAFYNSKANDGRLSPEDAAIYDRMEEDVMRLGKQIALYERQEAIEAELRQPTSMPLRDKPHTMDGKITRADAQYGVYFWDIMRRRVAENALQISEGSGGYLVPNEFESKIISALEDINIIRKLAHKIETDSGDKKIPIVASHGTAAWVSEGAAAIEADDVFDQIWLNSYKMSTMLRVSEELMNDSGIDIESYIAGEFARRFGATEEAAFINGNGVGKPTGLLHDTLGAQVGGVANHATKITADEIIDLAYSLRTPYRSKAVFVMNDSTLKEITKLKLGDGSYLWEPAISRGVPDVLLGHPVHTTTAMPEMAAGKKTILFGDFSHYWIADRKARTFKRLNELFATSGQCGFLASQRLDARLMLPEAMKCLRMAE